MSKPRIVAFLGKPGSGKGTQAELFAEKAGYDIFSSGAAFREMKERDDALGERIRKDYEQGLLMPGWFSAFIMQKEILGRPLSDNIVLEGSLRTEEEVVTLDEMMNWFEQDYIVFYLDLPDEESIRRNLKRGRGSDDESEEKIRARINEFNELTKPVIDYLKANDKLVVIDGDKSIEEIQGDIWLKFQEISA